jgi:hypothetical protein
MTAARFCLGALLLAAAVCVFTSCQGNAVPPEEVNAALGEYVTIYEAGVRVRMPKGFEEEGFSGLANRENKCVIFARRLPTPFHASFDKHVSSLKKKKILSREKVKVDGLEGVLLHLEDTVPDGDGMITRYLWDCVFGDENESTYISGVYYQDLPPIVGASLRASILSAQRDDSQAPKPGDRQSFTLPESATLKLVDESWKYYAFTEDGAVPTKSVESPILSAGNFPRVMKPDLDRKEFAEDMLRSERGLEKFEITKSEEITIDGLSGYELFANAVHAKSQKPISLYYVVLFQPSEYIMMAGYCGANVRKEYQPEFEAIAHGLKLKVKSK